MTKQELTDIFSTPYRLSEWRRVLTDVFNVRQLHLQPQRIPLRNKEKAEGAFELGNFNTSDDRIIGLYQVDVKPEVWLERNKVGLRELLRDVYKHDVDGALIVFVQEEKWRLSFVSEIRTINDEGEIEKKATEPKRYTYLLGKGEKTKTPVTRLFAIAGKLISLEDIRSAFSVEALNEEFYKIVARHFYQLVGATEGKGARTITHERVLKLPGISPADNTGFTIYQEFAVRLIGRTVFGWFLKVKKSDEGISLLPEHLLSSQAVKNNPNYYHFILEKIFFQTLNTPMEERITELPKGAEQIPFLNGGLFEPHDEDYYKPNKGTGLSDNINTLVIPDEWFISFFENLEQYNFTIDENSVVDIEVSVDPEMLGRIFENLLAEIDPDSGETARKATGSFYTPREIVDYMATESLVYYLHNQTGVDKESLHSLFKIDDPINEGQVFTECRIEILQALDKLKVLDPACGSGAFPMGVLQKIVMALQKLDKNASWWINNQVEKNTHPYARDAVRQKLTNNPEYARKIGVIQNSLYGVDIQPIAAEISKLRCFLTLIVDENIDETKPNRGVEPLPNLEFKFVTADALLKLPEDAFFGGLYSHTEELNQLQQLRLDYLQSFGEQKEKLKQEFKSIQNKIYKDELKHKNTGETRAYKISTWNPFDNDKVDWFDPLWMYGIKNFDIVIGNPPYRILTKNNTDLKLLEEYLNGYKTIKGASSKNLYIPFIENAIEFSISQTGLLSFIVPEGLFTTRSYIECVELMRKKGTVPFISTFSDFVFENAVTGNLVFLFSKSLNGDTQKFHFDKRFNIAEVSQQNDPIIERINTAKTTPLSKIAYLFKGMVVGDRSSVVGNDQSFGKDIFLLGKSIERWRVIKKFYTDYYSLNIVGGTKKKVKHDTVPRIIIRRTGDKLFSAFITKPALTESTLYSCWSTSKDFDNYFLLGLLNSKLLTYYIRHSMITNKQAFPQILMTDLELLPIINSTREDRNVLSTVVKYVLYLMETHEENLDEGYVSNSHIVQLFEQVIDALIYEQYLLEDFQNLQISFIEYAKKLFENIEGKTESEKRKIIKEVYQALNDKDNKIRQNLKLMDTRLGDLIMPIKTAS